MGYPFICNVFPKCDSTLCGSNFAATSPQQDRHDRQELVFEEIRARGGWFDPDSERFSEVVMLCAAPCCCTAHISSVLVMAA
jgi:hypothetical protein